MLRRVHSVARTQRQCGRLNHTVQRVLIFGFLAAVFRLTQYVLWRIDPDPCEEKNPFEALKSRVHSASELGKDAAGMIDSESVYDDASKLSQFCRPSSANDSEPNVINIFEKCRMIRTFDCRRVVEGDPLESTKAKRWRVPDDWIIRPEAIAELDCVSLRDWLNLPTKALSQAELEFPLAFAMLVHSSFTQFLLLLRRLYWPQNAYCVHVDIKATKDFRAATERIAACFPNVALAKESMNVTWGSPSYLMVTYNCLQQLHRLRGHSWKYAQVVMETDMPLRTNRELVEIFKIFNGSNDAELRQEELWRRENPWVSINGVWQRNLSEKKPPPPFGIQVYKGSWQATLSRAFVEFLGKDAHAKLYYKWALSAAIPDSLLFSTLNHNLHLNPPGGYPGECVTDNLPDRKKWVSRFQIWEDSGKPCGGKWARYSCLYGVNDMKTIMRMPHLMAHKLEIHFEPAALFCMHEALCSRTCGFCEGQPELRTQETEIGYFNRTHYAILPGVEYQNTQNKSSFVCPWKRQ